MDCGVNIGEDQRPADDLAADYCIDARAKRAIMTCNQPMQSFLGRQKWSHVLLHEFILGIVVVMEKRTCNIMTALHTGVMMWRETMHPT